MENLSKQTLIIGIIASSMCICTAAYAAIPVIDDQNILQQLKTYEETVKVVSNTKEQISLQLKSWKNSLQTSSMNTSRLWKMDGKKSSVS